MTLFYSRRGAGPPLVLLHGIGHHWRAWEPVLDRLAGHHDVIAVDLPGFGRSPVSGSFAGMPSLVEALASFFASLGLGRPHVAGNSLGGALALELAAAGHVASATALSPAGFATSGQLRYAVAVLTAHRLVARLPGPVVRTVLRSSRLRSVAFGMLLSRPGRISFERSLADTAALRDGVAFRAVARASRGYAFSGAPTVPVTVAWGTRDLILRYRQAAVARRGLPLARHVDLPGCGHVPMSDDPDLVADLILTTTGALPVSRDGL
ncbi:alpha/beta fold hydrolase [Asanoa sp. NPDC049573]|uniref:alpha/beta fold hydrolase n=1 Tax=Asanoa sp. NPDC049573 TaxID=3155396 RepID=UPI003444BE08